MIAALVGVPDSTLFGVPNGIRDKVKTRLSTIAA